MLNLQDGNNLIDVIKRLVGGAITLDERKEIVKSLNILLPLAIDSSPVDSGNLVDAVAGEPLGSNKVVYNVGGKVYLYSANDETLLGKVFGITKTAALQDDPIKVQVQGMYTMPGWGRTPGIYYAGLSGDIVPNPSGYKIMQIIGVAISQESLMIHVGSSILTI